MRNKLVLYTATLLLAAMSMARAQSAATQDSVRPTSSWIDFAYRGSNNGKYQFGAAQVNVVSDEARWQRYRDFRDGPLAHFGVTRETGTSAIELGGANVGYHDQQYTFGYNQFGKLKVDANWNSIPLNYSYNTLTPWKDQGNNVWTLDPAARLAVQNKTALGIGQTAADFNTASIFRSLATPFSMESRRDVGNLGVKYRTSDLTSISLGFTTTKKIGNQPYGASFAFNDANELPMAIDNRTNDVTTAFEWAKASTGMFRVGWNGSWFDNQFQSLTWDNPLRATDYSNGKLPPNGPYDASGYSNGNGPATGRLALPPSNSMSSFNALGMYRLPSHSTLNGQVSFTTMKQNAALLPWTTNANIANPAVYALFPGLASLPRASAEAEVRGVNALVNFTTRPATYLDLDLKYRYNDRQDRTPIFDASNNVRFDAVPEAVPGNESEHYNVTQNTIEGGASITASPGSVRLGYIFDDVKRDARAFSGIRDNTVRLSVDSYRTQYLMVRGLFEDTHRTGSGFSSTFLLDGGAQPGLRFYDEAPMHRNKGSLIFDVTPIEIVNVDLTLAAGKDHYTDSGQQFGLLDNSNASYNVALDVAPTSTLSFGGNFGYETIRANQKSRNANPFSGVAGAYESWNDANRDWNLNNNENVRNAGLFLDVARVLPKTDLKVSYDYSNSDNAFLFSGPRINEMLTNTALTAGDTKPCSAGQTYCFAPLPNITNSWHQLRADAKHMFTPQRGVGLTYSWERFEIVDYSSTNLADGTPRIDPLGAITTGYGNRPYNGSLVMMRLIYMF